LNEHNRQVNSNQRFLARLRPRRHAGAVSR
jgi:hypothetical protein